MKTLDLTGMKEYKFTMSVSALDCTGCGSCVNVCPGKKGAKALAMENLEANMGEQKYFDYGVTLPVKEDVIANWAIDKVFDPQMDDDNRQKLLKGWKKAVKCSYGWAKED